MKICESVMAVHTHTHTHTTLNKSVEVFHTLNKNNKLRQGSYTKKVQFILSSFACKRKGGYYAKEKRDILNSTSNNNNSDDSTSGSNYFKFK